jgi:hypothetical protein
MRNLLIGFIIGVCLVSFSTCLKQNKTVKINGKTYEVIKHDIDTFIIKKDTSIFKKGKDIYHDTTIYIPYEVGKPIDTAQILADYLAKNVFKDTLRLPDSLGFVYLTDTLQKNLIFTRNFKAEVKKTTIKESIYLKELPKSKLFVGGSASKSTFGAGVIYNHKEKRLFQAGIDYNVSHGTQLRVGYYLRLGVGN